jgi:hypothetical protein
VIAWCSPIHCVVASSVSNIQPFHGSTMATSVVDMVELVDGEMKSDSSFVQKVRRGSKMRLLEPLEGKHPNSPRALYPLDNEHVSLYHQPPSIIISRFRWPSLLLNTLTQPTICCLMMVHYTENGGKCGRVHAAVRAIAFVGHCEHVCPTRSIALMKTDSTST